MTHVSSAMNGSIILKQLMTIKSTIIDNSKIIFCNKNTKRYACYKNKQQSRICFEDNCRQFGCQILSIQDLPFVLAQINATRCISGQNKMIVFYSVFRILYSVRGGWCVSAQAIGNRHGYAYAGLIN